MSPGGLPETLTLRSFPRVSGDEPRLPTVVIGFPPFSPRERG